MGNYFKKPRYDVRKQAKDAIERDDRTEVERIPSGCSHRDSDNVTHILKQALLKDNDQTIVDNVLPHCTDSQTDLAVTELVSAGEWKSVTKLVKLVGDRKQTWTVEGTSVDTKLLYLVAGGMWEELGGMLEQGVDDRQFRWAIHATMSQAGHGSLEELMDVELSKRLDSLDEDTETGALLYTRMLTMLCDCSQNTSSTQTTHLEQFEKYILPCCAGDQLDFVLTTLVERRLWRAVEKVLKRGVSDSVKRWAVMEACRHSAYYFLKGILPHCADDQLDSVMKTLVDRRQWRAVGEVLTRGVSDSVKRWAVIEACRHSAFYILKGILPHCTDDQLDSVMKTLVDRRLWQAVEEMLTRGVSDSVKQWAIIEACRHGDSHAIQCIIRRCSDDQLDSVLTTLVERRLWWDVGEVLQRGVSDSVKRWAVEEACVTSDETSIKKHILPHCAVHHLDPVLTIMVQRHMWEAVEKVLQRVTGDSNEDLRGKETCEHCRSAGMCFREDLLHNAHSHVHNTFTQHCADGNLDSPTPASIQNDECTAVMKVSGRQVSDVQRRENIRAAFRIADNHTLIKVILPYYVYDSIRYELKMLASRGFWSAFLVLLHTFIIDTLYMWAIAKDTESKDKVFWDMVRNPCDGVKELTPAMWRSVTWSGLQRSLKQLLDWDTPLCEVLCESLLAIVREIWLSGRAKETYGQDKTNLENALSTVEHIHGEVRGVLMKRYTFSKLLACKNSLLHQYNKSGYQSNFSFQVYFIEFLTLQYHKRKTWIQMTDAILVVLTTVPVVPDVQSVALRVMLRHKRWDVIRHACLSGVCEQDRRQLFQAAVKQRQWSAVKRWADHTLYDDQRLWALGEARQEKRWDVYLKLADHGLSEWERVGVLFRVTMHADWKLVRHMLRTVADVTDMIDLLTKTPGTLSKLGAKKYKQRMSDLTEFKNYLTIDTNTLKTLKTMAKRGKWWIVLHNIRHKPNLQHARLALKAAVSSEAWHAVMQLVRLETDVTRRNSLFRDMVRLRQWAVCRELLEQGVSHELSLELLSELIEHCQWTLVAIVMDCPMDDKSRKKILCRAIMMREGSVVWECINKLQTGLSVDEREDLFQLAFSREVWQAVKPLIEEKDVTGVKHRDTALLEAIEQHQWDVVDHCQRHHADINMKDDDGHTPIHRAARKGDWEAVKELTVRDGDPNLLDSEGLSVLHRAIRAQQWDAVKLLIQFHGDIHQAVETEQTPLQMLIDAHQGELIESSLMWCPNQHKGRSRNGETVLHAVCLSGWPNTLYYLIARKVDPLAMTNEGRTALFYAVMCKDCPQRMVAECIKLGFSTQQPTLMYTSRSDSSKIAESDEPTQVASPLVLAVMRGLPVVTQMLYESGACSSSQLSELKIDLDDLTKKDFAERRNKMLREMDCANGFVDILCSFLVVIIDAQFGPTELMQKSAYFLREMCSTPRSLMSTCRLVISRCLTLSKTRHRDIAQLPLSPMMKNYLMFSDLTDPRYPDL